MSRRAKRSLPKKMEEAPPSPPELLREPSKKRAPRKKPDLSGVEPKEITIKTAKGEKTFSARSRPRAEKADVPVEPEVPAPANPWSSVLNAWLD